MTTTIFERSPVNLTDGIWREDDLAARCVIRRTYRRERYRGRYEARTAAQTVAVALADLDTIKRFGP